MTRRLVDVDDDALARAAEFLGTDAMDETIDQALRLVASMAADESQRARFGELLDLVGDRLVETDVRADAWRS